jgi:hypothetical protein
MSTSNPTFPGSWTAEHFCFMDGEVWFMDRNGTPIAPAWTNDDAELDAFLATAAARTAIRVALIASFDAEYGVQEGATA